MCAAEHLGPYSESISQGEGHSTVHVLIILQSRWQVDNPCHFSMFLHFCITTPSRCRLRCQRERDYKSSPSKRSDALASRSSPSPQARSNGLPRHTHSQTAVLNRVSRSSVSWSMAHVIVVPACSDTSLSMRRRSAMVGSRYETARHSRHEGGITRIQRIGCESPLWYIWRGGRRRKR